MNRWIRRWALACSGGVLLGIVPGCVEIAILQWATPFLLSN
jgi:hypothetical protein